MGSILKFMALMVLFIVVRAAKFAVQIHALRAVTGRLALTTVGQLEQVGAAPQLPKSEMCGCAEQVKRSFIWSWLQTRTYRRSRPAAAYFETATACDRVLLNLCRT